MKSNTLLCNRLTGKHTAENVHEKFCETHTFKITAKVSHVVASNMIKAFRLPGFNCFSTFKVDDETDESDSDDDDDGESDLDICPQLVEELNSQITTEHIGCFAHTLQLTIKDGFKESTGIDTKISKCSRIVSFVRKSTIATDILEGVNRLQTENCTRWNSQLAMIQSVLNVPKEKLAKLHN